MESVGRFFGVLLGILAFGVLLVGIAVLLGLMTALLIEAYRAGWEVVM